MNITDNERSGGRKYRLAAPKVDMTPMVDLGFLLITFFNFTTSISKPTAMKLAMPKDDGDPTPVKCSASLTIVPEGPDRVGWYDCTNGVEAPVQYAPLNGKEGIREILLHKRQAVARQFGDPKDMVVMIKPSAACDYATLVGVLDEMTINGISRYAIVD